MSSASTESYIVKRTEFLVISDDSEILSRVKEVADYYAFKTNYAKDVFSVDSEGASKSSPQVVFISLLKSEALNEKIAAVKHISELCPRSQIILVVPSDDPTESQQALRDAGADRLLFDYEITSSSKIFYLCALLVQGTYVPIQVMDLFPSTQVGFNAYHKLPINQKYLPVIFSGFQFSDKKYRRLESAKQVYVRREDLNEYRKYIEAFHDSRGNALKKRCRATMMSLMAVYTELVILLSLESERTKHELVKSQIEQYLNTVRELASYLKECPDVWNVIFQSLDFQFCRQERGPSVLAYAIYIAQKLELSNFENIAMGILLADLGILDLPPSCYKQFLQGGELRLSPPEREIYQQHPKLSLARVLDGRVEISKEIQDILICTHERADGKGFPNQLIKEAIPFEAQLIQFCENLDRRVRANLESGMLTHDFVRKQVWEEEKVSLACFSADFLDKIETVIVTAVA